MHRTTHRGSFLVVEGQNDSSLFKKYTLESRCIILSAFSRQNVIDTLFFLEEREFFGTLGLIDRDFLDFLSAPELPKNIVCTEENDIEVMIICSPVLSNFLRVYGSPAKIKNVEISTGKEIRDLIFEEAAKLGSLRLLSKLDDLNLKFSEMNFHFVRNSSIEINTDRQLNHILARSSGGKKPSLEYLKRRITEIIANVDNVKRLCSGHDCVRILGKSIRNLLGTDSQFDSKNKIKNLDKVLRLAYERGFFEQSQTYSAIKQWETRTGYRIFET